MPDSLNTSAVAARPINEQTPEAPETPAAPTQDTDSTDGLQTSSDISPDEHNAILQSLGLPPMPPEVADYFRKKQQDNLSRTSKTPDVQPSAPSPLNDSQQTPPDSASPDSATSEPKSPESASNPSDEPQTMQLVLDCLMPMTSPPSQPQSVPQSDKELPSYSMPERLPGKGLSAQHELRRRNGSKSKGPKSPKGKRRSSMNALKHGLLAKDSTWAWEQSNDQTDRAALIKSLKETHQPKNQLEVCLLEITANDIIRIRRAMAMQESIMDPVLETNLFGGVPRFTPEKLEQANARMELITLLRDRLKQGQAFSLSPQQAEDLSQFMVDRLKDWQTVCSQTAKSIDEENDDEYRLRLPLPTKSLKEVMGHLSPHGLGLLDQPNLSRQLQSSEPVCEPLQRRWTIFLDLMNLTMMVYCQREEIFARENAVKLQKYRMQQAGMLHQLELLERYETRYRRHLANQMQLLEQSRRMGRELDADDEDPDAASE